MPCHTLIAGDFNIDTSMSNRKNVNYLNDFCHTFDLTNLVNVKTCFKSTLAHTSIDVILTNRPRSFQKTAAITTGLSDCHKMVITSFRSFFSRAPPRDIIYRSYQKFNSQNFLDDLNSNLNQAENSSGIVSYEKLTQIFKQTIQTHAPLKKRRIRGNQAPFMTKELSKQIMKRSRYKNKYYKWPSRENFLAYKNAKNRCNNMLKYAKRVYFRNISLKNGSKSFWDAVKPFFTNKGIMSNENIVIEEDGILLNDTKTITEIFNNHYINIVEKSSGKPPSSIGNPNCPSNDRKTVKEIINAFKNHPSIIAIKRNNIPNCCFDIPHACKDDINKIIKSLNTKKATGPDGIPLKLIKLSADIIDYYLTTIINDDLSRSSFSEGAKEALVHPIFKKKDRKNKENYRPVSILNGFSKVYERFINDSMLPIIQNFLSDFVSAYRKHYSSNHILINLLENWKKNLDNKKIVGAVFMDLSKAFDCIPHDLLIAKMDAYGFSEDFLTFLYSYLKRRKQSVNISNVHSIFQILLSGVPQGSILGPLLFNVFINDLFHFINDADLLNFADDNTITAFSDSLENLIYKLEKESTNAIDWFRSNEMIVNPDKFQSIIVNNGKNTTNSYKLRFDKKTIESENSINVLGIEIDNKLNFDNHTTTLCKKAGGQLNALARISKYIGFHEMKVLLDSFIFSNFNYCPLVWHFCSVASTRKIEKIQERALRLLYNDNFSTYNELLQKASKPTMEVNRMRKLAVEIFKTLNSLNPNYMKLHFKKGSYSTRRKNNLVVNRARTTTFGEKSLQILGPKIWNSLPENAKEQTSIKEFNKFIKTWYGPKCMCNICQYSGNPFHYS